MSNRINNAINLIGTEIINTLQDISTPIMATFDDDENKLKKKKKGLKYYYNENNDYIYVCIELPGVDKQNCNIEICGGYLKLNAKTNYQMSNNNDINVNEFKFIQNHNIEENIDLNSNNIDETQVSTNFINGLLKIKLKKKPKTNININ
jgi:HSP20 family molecular chaperone IbpA